MVKRLFSNWLTALFLTTLMSSCEKMTFPDESGSSDSEGSRVVLRVTRFEKVPFGVLTRAELPDLCTRLTFIVSNENGEKVKTVTQQKDDNDFGKVTLRLAEGEYKLCVFAHSSKSNPKMDDFPKIKFENAKGFTDTFFYAGDLTVGEEAKEMDLGLDRIVARLHLTMEDVLPPEVKQIYFRYTGGSGTFDAYTGLGCVNSIQTATFEFDGTQKEFDLYTFLKDRTGIVKLQIKAFDASGNIVAENEFSEVPMQRNMVTTYKGACFASISGNSSTHTYSVHVDDSWEGEIVYP